MHSQPLPTNQQPNSYYVVQGNGVGLRTTAGADLLIALAMIFVVWRLLLKRKK